MFLEKILTHTFLPHTLKTSCPYAQSRCICPTGQRLLCSFNLKDKTSTLGNDNQLMNKHCHRHPALHLRQPKCALRRLLSSASKAHALFLPEDARAKAQAPDYRREYFKGCKFYTGSVFRFSLHEELQQLKRESLCDKQKFKCHQSN